MRSSKSRSRNKSNRNRSVGNIVNRVFDSSGPEGKVRGTPQQIIDKYTQLARDAQLGNDRVAAENFQQHAEHYTRMLGEALREQEARREQQEQQQQQRSRREEDEVRFTDPGNAPQPDAEVIDVEGSSGLVETPEQKRDGNADKPKRPRRPRRTEPESDGGEPDRPQAAE